MLILLYSSFISTCFAQFISFCQMILNNEAFLLGLNSGHNHLWAWINWTGNVETNGFNMEWNILLLNLKIYFWKSRWTRWYRIFLCEKISYDVMNYLNLKDSRNFFEWRKFYSKFIFLKVKREILIKNSVGKYTNFYFIEHFSNFSRNKNIKKSDNSIFSLNTMKHAT